MCCPQMSIIHAYAMANATQSMDHLAVTVVLNLGFTEPEHQAGHLLS